MAKPDPPRNLYRPKVGGLGITELGRRPPRGRRHQIPHAQNSPENRNSDRRAAASSLGLTAEYKRQRALSASTGCSNHAGTGRADEYPLESIHRTVSQRRPAEETHSPKHRQRARCWPNDARLEFPFI